LRRADDLRVVAQLTTTPFVLRKSALVRSVRFSPADEFTLALGHPNGYATVWDMTPGREPRRTHTFPHPSDEVWSVDFSPDGGSLVTGCADGLVRVWPLAGGRPVAVPGAARPDPDSAVVAVVAVASTPPRPGRKDDRMVLAAGSGIGPGGDGFFVCTRGDQHWLAPPGGGPPAPFPRTAATGAAFAPDGRGVLTFNGGFSASEPVLRWWPLEDGRPRGRPAWENSSVARLLAAAFRPPAGREVVGGSAGEVVWLNAATGGTLAAETLPAPVSAVAYRADGSAVAAGRQDGRVRCWVAGSRHPLGPGFDAGVSARALAFSPDGVTLLAGLADGTVRLWDVPTGLPIGPALTHIGSITSIEFGPDGRSILTAGAAGTGGTVRTWAVRSGS
jgi:WD40 repeat protein